MMQGKIVGDTFIVIDSFALPVEGTETRVNAQVCATQRCHSCLSPPSLSPSLPRRTSAHSQRKALIRSSQHRQDRGMRRPRARWARRNRHGAPGATTLLQ